MDPDRRRRTRELFDQASELEPSEQEALEEASRDDVELRQEVEALLARTELRAPIDAQTRDRSRAALPRAPLSGRIGPYRILKVLGERHCSRRPSSYGGSTSPATTRWLRACSTSASCTKARDAIPRQSPSTSRRSRCAREPSDRSAQRCFRSSSASPRSSSPWAATRKPKRITDKRWRSARGARPGPRRGRQEPARPGLHPLREGRLRGR